MGEDGDDDFRNERKSNRPLNTSVMLLPTGLSS